MKSLRIRSLPARMAAALALACGGQSAAQADITLPHILSDGMVLQQRTPVRIFGKADPGESVTVTFQSQTARSTAGSDGKWAVLLRPLKPGGPYSLTLRGKNAIELKNVLVGEVWLCGGQSNMEWPLSKAYDAPRHLAASANPEIRLFLVAKARSDRPQEDVQAVWKECGPETVGGFSAVGYFFGRDLQKARGVPVGLIGSYWGGTPAEAWTREEVLAADPTLKEIVDSYPAERARYERALAAYQEAVKAKSEGRSAPRRPNLWRYSELYNAMIAPLTSYTIAGAIWYQGESNAGRAAQYRTLFPAMIRNWRQDWQAKEMPFLLVQLAPYGAISRDPQDTNWAHLREAQMLATQVLPGVGMAVITDVGEEHDIHPTKKEPVGARMALLARKIAYGEKRLVASGPTYRSFRVSGGKAILSFDNVGLGLEARPADSAGNQVPPGKLVGFAVAGKDGKFVWADATIQGRDSVVVSSPQVPEPVSVRFGWADYPVVNFWNRDGLPASPFRTDGSQATR